MASKLSPEGLQFISSWSLFSETTFRVEQNLNNTLYVGYLYYGSPLPYKPQTTIDKTTTVTPTEALNILNQELIGPAFNLVQDFGFTRFTQNQLDALISICTTYRTSDYFRIFKTTKVYEALKSDAPVDTVAELIKTDLPVPPEVEEDPKRSGIFYSLDERRVHESNLYLISDYSPCTALTAQRKNVDNIVVFY